MPNPLLKNLSKEDGKLLARDDIFPFARIRFDSNNHLTVGRKTTQLLEYLMSLSASNPELFRKDIKDIRFAKVAAQFLDKKVAPIYISGVELSLLPMVIAKLVQRLSEKGLRMEVRRVVSEFTDMPSFIRYHAQIVSEYFAGGASGWEGEETETALAAIAEAMERKLLGNPSPRWLKKAHPRTLRGRIFPEDLLAYFLSRTSDIPKFSYDDPALSLSWTLGFDWIGRTRCWLPAQLVFWFKSFPEEPRFVPRTTNGCAGGRSLSEAILKALLELIERDAFLISWLKMLKPKNVSLDSILKNQSFDENLKKFIADMLRYRFELNLLLLPTDFPVFVFCCVLRDPSKVGPAVAVGADADFDPQKAISAALLEASGVYILGRRRIKPAIEVNNNINATINYEIPPAYNSDLGRDGRLMLWAEPYMFQKIEWFLDGQRITIDSLQPSSLANKNSEEQLAAMTDFIKKRISIFSYTLHQKKCCGN